MTHSSLTRAVAAVPAGAWAVGVSGGADSVALLRLLLARSDLRLIVAHFNHQSRGAESDADLEFVRQLCRELKVGRHLALREEIERADFKYSNNPSAKFRQLRFQLFRDVVKNENLDGVILAHHADDHAETVLQRLLRGSGYSALAGIAPRASIDGVTVLHPLLNVRRQMLRDWLSESGFSWREDASNESPAYQRNRLRAILRERDDLVEPLMELSCACANLQTWVSEQAPNLPNEFACEELADLPALLARHAAGEWLAARSSPMGSLDRAVVERLVEMCADAATSARQDFPGQLSVARKRGKIRCV